MKGQVADETGNYLQNVTILQHSTGNVYTSGEEGAFGIISNKPADTLSFSMDGYQKITLQVDASHFIEVKLKKLPYSLTHTNKLSSLTHNLKRETQKQWFNGNETYASTIENQFIDASLYPATGITLNVDKASYSNIRRFIKMRTYLPPEAVRIEEMLNYFNLDYKDPPNHQTFALESILTGCPWNEKHQLLFAHLVSKRLSLDSLPPSNLVFLIDVSGSMDMPNRLPLLKNAFKSLVKNLRAKDSVTIIQYGGGVGFALLTTSGSEKEKIEKAIDSLQAGGATPGESGIKLAYSAARNHYIKGGNNRIILATDGDFNVGLRTDEELEELILKQRKAGVYLTCLGVGMGNYKDSKIQTLANKGNGNFAYLDNYLEAEKVLLKEFTQTLFTVADNAYLNVQFDPSLVREYKLIGFDNKVGAIKDTLAQIEGGEIGPAYSSLIAFEIEPADNAEMLNPSGRVKPASFQLQYRQPHTNNDLQFSITPDVYYIPFAQLNHTYQFATSIIMFGAKLKRSPFTRNIKWNEILRVATAAADKSDFTQAEMLFLIQQSKSIYRRRHRREE